MRASAPALFSASRRSVSSGSGSGRTLQVARATRMTINGKRKARAVARFLSAKRGPPSRGRDHFFSGVVAVLVGAGLAGVVGAAGVAGAAVDGVAGVASFAAADGSGTAADGSV